MILKLRIWLFFLVLPLISNATHIVGGVLNYKKGSGNVYTITLKLYRDCGSSAAAFPGNVTINIRGNNGANFSPSKDLTINLGNVTTISPNLAPCAVAPNPMPCVQEGIYTKTISLPPNTGGYHLYYQVTARNLSLTNINGACNCIGESFYAYIPNNSSNSNSNSNAVFSLFPPLFICVNQPFTFNHSATDLDGDSLAYSLYTPFDGDNGTGSLDPTFPSNVATFAPVNYLSGFTTSNPLGASPFSLNPVTGVLSGTPALTGQFVVGVRVREYRNGIVISQTLRDFQFNVLNCPTPPPTLAISNMTINNGCSIKLIATGITTASSVWSSISPGAAGAYNNYLSCTSACLQPSITAVGTPPAYVDFKVCGIATNCLANNICDTFRVQFNPPLTVSIAPTKPALCNGQTSTTITAFGSGGTPPYSYLWNNVNPTQSVSVGAGTYNIKLTDGSGCPPAYNSVVVNTYSVPVAALAGPDQVRCNTNPLAIINATITGATGGIWSGGTGTFSPNNITTNNLNYTPSAAELALGSATLYLTSTGNGNCPSSTDTVVITYVGFTGTVSLNTSPVKCYGGNTGSATVSVAGGFAPHNYFWSSIPTQTTNTISALTNGNYSVTITNSLGCISNASINITQPSPLSSNANLQAVTCFAGNNGSVNITGTGGVGPYTYTIQPGAINTNSATTLTAGNYTATTKDNNACVYTSTIAITQPSILAATFSVVSVKCFGASSGSISTTISGGASPYSFSWSPGGISSPALNSIPAGTYTLTVTDFTNCTLTKTVNVTQASSLVLATSVNPETCDYLNNGTATATVNGGTSGYTYLWQPGAFTTSTINNLAAGNYSLTVTDANTCTISKTVTVTEPLALILNFQSQKNVNCFAGTDGSITAIAAGGTSPYSYVWSSGAGNTNTFTNLSAGTYSLNLTDARSCTVASTFNITQPSSLSLVANTQSVTCYLGNNGSATVTANGGTSPYSYLWQPVAQTTSIATALTAGNYTAIVYDAKNCSLAIAPIITQATSITIAFTSSNVSCFAGSDGKINSIISGGTAPYAYNWVPGNQTTPNISNLAQGNYTLSITDGAGCTQTKTTTISQAPVLKASGSFTNETCNYLDNGKADLTISGGTPAYTFLWMPGAMATKSLSNLSSGAYTATIVDIKTCSTTVVVTIAEPAPLTVLINTITPVGCFGGSNGSAIVNPNGGTPNYSYSWSPSSNSSNFANNLSQGVYTVTVSDQNACVAQQTLAITQPSVLSIADSNTAVSCFGGNNGVLTLTVSGGNAPYNYLWLNNGANTSSISNLTANNYSVTITDAKSCTLSSVFAVGQSSALAIAFTTTNVSCVGGNNGKINSSVSGGNAPYAYNWQAGSQTTQNVTALTAGVYTLTVTDFFNCVFSNTTNISEPFALDVVITTTNETCDYNNDGAVSALASGGTAPYTYTWFPNAIASQTCNNLSSGIYTLVVSDAANCSITKTTTIAEPAPFVLTFTNIVNVSCNLDNDGSATAIGVGGTANYTFTWTPSSSNAAMATQLSAGIYTINALDQNACATQETVVISEPAPLVLVPSISNVVCSGGSNGAISISTSGGTGPYANLLNPGNIVGANFSNLAPGNYTLQSTDANNCTTSTTLDINQPINFSTASSFTDAACMTQNGVASISVTSGGTAPFTYSWLPSGGTASISTNLFAGSYTIQVSDALGCTSSKIVNISNISAPVVSIVSATNVSCYGGNNGALIGTHSAGSGPYSYSWSPAGGNGLSANGLSAGVYVFQVTDNSGCVGFIASTPVTQPTSLTANIIPKHVSCFAGNNGQASANVNGGTLPYVIQWLPSASAGTAITNLSANQYSVSITDALNCNLTQSFQITQPASPLSASFVTQTVTCFSYSNGVINASANGGTAPYNYTIFPGNYSAAVFFNLPTGNYTIATSDIKSCQTSNTIALIQATQITLTTSAINSNCAYNNGQVSVLANGGNGTYTYSWTPNGGTNSVSNPVVSGTYSVLVKDGNNCFASASRSVADNPAPTISISQVTAVSCYGGNNGSALSLVSGGTAPFTYSWLPSGGTASLGTSLSAGNYSVIVTAANSCTAISLIAFVSEPNPLLVTLTNTAVNCFGGNDGASKALVTGGTPAYSYTWLPLGTNAQTANLLTANNYTAIVKDANNCLSSATTAISGPSAPLSLTAISLPALCFGSSNGSASCTPSGGTGACTFVWMPGNISGQNISGLVAGSYTVLATDQNSCTASAVVIVTQPTAIALSSSTLNSNCSLANGAATITAIGGTGAFNFQWSGLAATSAANSTLNAGTYIVTAIDQNTCTASLSLTITDLPAPLLTVSSVTAVTCYGGNNGSALATVVGGTGPFTYSWSPSASTSSLASGLSAGTHTVLVTAFNGCTNIAVSPLVTEPTALYMNIITSSVACFGQSTGAATIFTGGGTPTYVVTDASGAALPTTLSGLPVGIYSLQLNDSQNCQTLKSFTINGPANALDITVTKTNSVACFAGATGSSTVNTVGGTAPYTFNWLPFGGTAVTSNSLIAGTYTVYTTDVNGCNTFTNVIISEPAQALSALSTVTNVNCFGGNNAQIQLTTSGGTPLYTYSWTPSGNTNALAVNLSLGVHAVKITDQNNCQTNMTVQVTEPARLSGTLITIQPSCNRSNGFIISQISGGTNPFNYLWTPIAYTAATVSSLSPGTYSLLVNDALNCNITLTATLSNIVGPALTTNSVTNVSCFGGNNGAATISIQQGTAPFNYNWLPFGGNATSANSLIAGTYSAMVIDALGCGDTIDVQISEPPILSAIIVTVSNVSCKNGNNGTINALALGGTPAYSYSWTPSNSGANITQLVTGTYTLTVKDQKNCTKSISTFVDEPTLLKSTITGVNNAICFSANGSATVDAQGGTAPYSYDWNTTPANTSNILSAKAGTYSVKITDANSCTLTTTMTIIQPKQIVTSVIKLDTICVGKTRSLIPSAIGGNGNYYYSWQPGALTTTAALIYTASSNVTYTVLAFDDKGCSGLDAQSKITVYDLKAGNIIVSGHTPICPGQTSLIEAQTNGVTGPLTFSWNNGLGNKPGIHIVKPAKSTVYVITAKNSCGATLSDSINVIISALPTVKINSDSLSACVPELIQFRDSSGTLNTTDPIVSWMWDFNDGTFSAEQHPYHAFDKPGKYIVNVEVTTDRGCVNTSSVPVQVELFPKPIAAFSVNKDTLDLPYDQLICTNQSTGAINYNWTFEDNRQSTQENPKILLQNLGDQHITLIAFSNKGCSDTVSKAIHTDADIIFPTAFTPNEAHEPNEAYNVDALDNDILFPYTSGVTDYSFQVFNRWGELIYESRDYKKGWNGYYRGKLCQQGVYVWKAKITLSNGKIFDQVGNVTLIR